jgi:Tfp pilus assembly protein PilN
MIQFNLLPDVKIKYIKTRRQKRLVMLGSFLVGSAALALIALGLLFVYGIQGAQLTLVNNDIKKSNSSINRQRGQVDDINKVLTVQNQLVALDGLHSGKPITSRIFDYLTRLTPSGVNISKLTVNTVAGSEEVTIQGSTDTLETVNKFVDTLKFSTFAPSSSEADAVQVFTEVVLASFSRDKVGATYTVSFKYDPMIFDLKNQTANLVVPKGLITTRSEIGRPILQTDAEANEKVEGTE